MASIFKALGGIFSTVSDSAETINSAIANFREEQRVDHAIEKLQRQSRILKETKKSLGEIQKNLQSISDTELALVNSLYEELGYSQLKK